MATAPKKILALKLRSLGDTVLMTAPLAELRKAYPQAEIHVAVTSTWAPLLEGHPAIHTLWKYERYVERGARAKAAARLALKLRRERYDCVVNFHASPSSSMISFATGARLRSVHFHGHKDRNRHSTVEVPGKGILKPIIERDMDTIRALGLHVPPGRMPEIFLQDSEKAQAREWIARLGILKPGSVTPTQAPKDFLMIGLGASRPTKRWPVERFASLAVEWATQRNGGVLAIAGPGESQEVLDFMKSVDDLLLIAIPDAQARAAVRARITSEHRLPLRQLASIISQASVFVGNDSGPRHIAVAVQTPTVTLFGPEHPFEWHPYPTDRHPYEFIDNLPCRRDALPGYPAWCGVEPCVTEELRCMRLIGVDQVLADCERVARSGSA